MEWCNLADVPCSNLNEEDFDNMGCDGICWNCPECELRED